MDSGDCRPADSEVRVSQSLNPLPASAILNAQDLDILPATPFDTLAVELIQRILLFAVVLTDHRDRPDFHGPSGQPYFPYTALRVSKACSAVATSSPELWTYVFASEVPNLIKKFKKHTELARQLQSQLHITFFATGRISRVLSGIFRRYRSHIKSFDCLCLPGSPDSSRFSEPGTIIFWHDAAVLWNNLQDLQVIEDPAYQTASPRHYFFNIAINIPNLRRLVLQARNWNEGTHYHLTTSPVTFPRLEELSLHLQNLRVVTSWLQSVELPVLRRLAVTCYEELDLSALKHWKDGGQLRPLPTVRSLALYGTGEHASRVVLGCLPNIEQLVITLDKKGRLPACLGDAAQWPNLRRIAIRNPYSVALDRGREILWKRRETLKTVAVNRGFGKCSKLLKWLREFVRVEIWPDEEFGLGRIMDRMEWSA